VPNVCASLEEALKHIEDDHAFLTRGGVFSEDFLESYIALKNDELTRFRMTTHPVEFDMYYAS
jgi:glutamine synthetase